MVGTPTCSESPKSPTPPPTTNQVQPNPAPLAQVNDRQGQVRTQDRDVKNDEEYSVDASTIEHKCLKSHSSVEHRPPDHSGVTQLAEDPGAYGLQEAAGIQEVQLPVPPRTRPSLRLRLRPPVPEGGGGSGQAPRVRHPGNERVFHASIQAPKSKGEKRSSCTRTRS